VVRAQNKVARISIAAEARNARRRLRRNPVTPIAILLYRDHRRRPRRPFKTCALLLHALQLAFPAGDLSLGSEELRAFRERDQLPQFTFLKARAFDAVLKGVELAAQEFLSRDSCHVPFKFRVGHIPFLFLNILQARNLHATRDCIKSANPRKSLYALAANVLCDVPLLLRDIHRCASGSLKTVRAETLRIQSPCRHVLSHELQ
jgi:hypothetical protein